MSKRILRLSSAVLITFALTVTSAAPSKAEDGIVEVKSAYSVQETIERLKKDNAAKGIRFFSEIDKLHQRRLIHKDIKPRSRTRDPTAPRPMRRRADLLVRIHARGDRGFNATDALRQEQTPRRGNAAPHLR